MFKFLKAARSLVNQGMSKEAIEQFAKNEFGEINELFQKQIDNLFKQKQGIENIKIKDEVFDDTVIKLPIDDTGQPFNPRDPLKDYSKELTDSPLDDLKKIVDDFKPMGPPKPRDKKYTGGRAGYGFGSFVQRKGNSNQNQNMPAVDARMNLDYDTLLDQNEAQRSFMQNWRDHANVTQAMRGNWSYLIRGVLGAYIKV